MMTSNRELVDACAAMFEQRVAEGWLPTLLTFMFDELGGTPQTRWTVMQREIERVHGTLVTRVVRDPSSPSHAWKRPIWLAAPDFPVHRRGRFASTEGLPNDGQHAHAAALMPPVSRLPTGLVQHLIEKEKLYVRSPLVRIDAEPVSREPGYVTRYVLKAIARGRVSEDALLVLPRARSERSGGPSRAGNAPPASRGPVAVGVLKRRPA